jgi:hypothetical protein
MVLPLIVRTAVGKAEQGRRLARAPVESHLAARVHRLSKLASAGESTVRAIEGE